MALIPLFIFAGLYDRYFEQLVSKITDGRVNTQVAAVQNEFKVYLRERLYQLDVLADELDSPEIFSPKGKSNLSNELEALLRLQTDLNNVYGVAFFNSNKQLLWSFPENSLSVGRYASILPFNTPFEDAELLGPEPYSFNHPASVLLMKQLSSSKLDNEPFYIGLIIRFNSITSILKSLSTDGIFTPYLSTPGDRYFDIVGQPAELLGISQSFDLISNWSISLNQNGVLAEPPSAALRYWLIVLVLFTAACLLIVHWYISRRLNTQVSSLIEGIERVASGDLMSPVPQQRGTEIERLTDAIEKMRFQLSNVIQSNIEMDRRASLGNLSAGLAHDIRNPLNIIRMTTKALIKRESKPENKEMLTMMVDELDRANRVLDNLLNFARPSQPKQELLNVSYELNLILNFLQTTAKAQKVDIRIVCDESFELSTDSGHLHQALINLVLNSIQSFNGNGGTILLKSFIKKEYLCIAVIDDGPGIPNEIRSRILEPFFTTKETGTGLGLAICQSLVQANHGRIHIDSCDTGTVVELQFPHQPNLDDTYE
ncbi:two-component system sensor histidine kinase NtrB [Marinomonas fungiae]|uniref:two-component system sensor histidine kinase NtrB n=1 Tax=Marinomonas fungiae TaxID=1137284 RepID=UPI0006E29A0A|nr:HAMP domain-containing sensor histidine kinase [Marinomonas fungiae]